jgi:hypothetical protein
LHQECAAAAAIALERSRDVQDASGEWWRAHLETMLEWAL